MNNNSGAGFLRLNLSRLSPIFSSPEKTHSSARCSSDANTLYIIFKFQTSCRLLDSLRLGNLSVFGAVNDVHKLFDEITQPIADIVIMPTL
jgi:hypothetical protein